MIQIINACPNLSFDGFHAHIGSQIFDKEAFVQEVNKVCEFVSNLGVDVSTLNLVEVLALYIRMKIHPFLWI